MADGEEKGEEGQLVYQQGKKVKDYFIVSVRENADGYIKFSATELDTLDPCEVSYSHADFEVLFKGTEHTNPAEKEARYAWVIDRLDLTTDGGGGKRLVLRNEPTVEEEGQEAKPSSPPKAVRRERISYSERMRLKREQETLDEKRASSIALKREKNRKAFVAELQQKRKLEELKIESRRQRIDEERAQRREKAAMEKHLQEERMRRFTENEKKRAGLISQREKDRHARELGQIKDIVESQKQKKRPWKRSC
jgi:hypothetical protein